MLLALMMHKSKFKLRKHCTLPFYHHHQVCAWLSPLIQPWMWLSLWTLPSRLGSERVYNFNIQHIPWLSSWLCHSDSLRTAKNLSNSKSQRSRIDPLPTCIQIQQTLCWRVLDINNLQDVCRAPWTKILNGLVQYTENFSLRQFC